ncbi:MAG: sulfatase-like hydrolase/transferase, partial [Rikenellaceae bacterium]
MKLKLLCSSLAALGSLCTYAQSSKPNVIVILADDLGFGDLSCYGMDRIQTPNVDRLAASGTRFTSAHTSSATSTPSRYSLLTGEYAWRTPGTGVATGDAAMIIKPQ